MFVRRAEKSERKYNNAEKASVFVFVYIFLMELIHNLMKECFNLESSELKKKQVKFMRKRIFNKSFNYNP